MQITCTICSDLFVATDTVVGTNCGHVFHHQCLIRWLERSKSCPQCRAQSHEESIHRIYFTVHDQITVDSNALQNKIDILHTKMLLKDNVLKKCREEIESCREEIESYKTKTDGLEGEIKLLKINNKTAAANHTILKVQLNIYKKQNEDLAPVIRQCENLQKEVQFLRKEMHIRASNKEELCCNLREAGSKIFSLTAQVRRMQEALTAQQEQNTHLLMEEDRAADERNRLMHKIQVLEQTLVSLTDSHRFLTESPAPSLLNNAFLHCTEGEVLVASPEAVEHSEEEEEESPYLNIKSSSVGLNPLRPSNRKNKCSFFRKPHMSESTAPTRGEYNGMGGHSKPDEFPRRIPQMQIKKIDKHQSFSKMKLKDALNCITKELLMNK